MNNLGEIAGVLGQAQSFLICGHEMPDGDALGSVLALGFILEKLGKKVVMAGPDPVPQMYRFLPGVERFQAGEPPRGEFDYLVALDCSVPERLGNGYRELLAGGLPVINIDHHVGSVSFGTYRFVDVNAAAVGEIIFDLAGLLEVKISPNAATCLYTAIVTDTGAFRYDNTSSATHRRVAQLLELGVSAAQVNVLVYEEKPGSAIRLLGAALSTLSLSACGKVGWLTVTRDMLRLAGAEDEHTEGLVNYARRIAGVEVGLLFRELADGRYKISFRSKNYVDVNRLAGLFGGGGHARAAGCVLRGDLAIIRERIVAAAVEATGGIKDWTE